MKWIDAATADAARVDAEDPNSAPHQHIPGVCFRTDDGTTFGRWRVAAESRDDGTLTGSWAIWDLRRGPERGPTPVRVVGGLPTLQQATRLAHHLDRHASLRVVLALLRGLAWAAECVLDEVQVTRRGRRPCA